MRYREMEHVDLAAARRLVAGWLDEHTSGPLEQMASDLKGNYPHPDEMAVVLRGMAVAELRRRTSSPPIRRGASEANCPFCPARAGRTPSRSSRKKDVNARLPPWE
jgi:hypothetical protein